MKDDTEINLQEEDLADFFLNPTPLKKAHKSTKESVKVDKEPEKVETELLVDTSDEDPPVIVNKTKRIAREHYKTISLKIINEEGIVIRPKMRISPRTPFSTVLTSLSLTDSALYYFEWEKRKLYGTFTPKVLKMPKTLTVILKNSNNDRNKKLFSINQEELSNNYSDILSIKIRTKKTTEFYKYPKSTKIDEILEAFNKEQGENYTKIIFDGDLLNLECTLEENEIEDEDMLECF
eukprot:GHVP01056339.1.p1 GENE.GHVP01056339.1~~GHVP01056339.1.p1  ORF type:complete len:236 (+),score=48.26 GHVP01056339.1:2466-3173(+)